MDEKNNYKESQKQASKPESQITQLQAALSERDAKIKKLEKVVTSYEDLIENASVGIEKCQA